MSSHGVGFYAGAFSAPSGSEQPVHGGDRKVRSAGTIFATPMRLPSWIHHPRVLLLASCCLLAASATAQPRAGAFDTLYVLDMSRILTGRVYLSTKDNAFTLGARGAERDLTYRPNNRINLGVGASYRALTLNIGFGVPFLNDDDVVRGETRYFDAQANIYTKRQATNLFLQVFSGYYVDTYDLSELNWTPIAIRPYRPDVWQFNFGVSSVRILQSDRFSYRASFNQDAWQRRSAGSWLLGGYATYFAVRADSSLVPSTLAGRFTTDVRLRNGDFMDLGPMGGYACTFVLAEHWFATISGVAGLGLTYQDIAFPFRDGEQRRKGWGIGWHAQWRMGMGYNSRRHYVGLSYNEERIGYFLGEQQRFTWVVSNLRFNVVRRFNVSIPFMDRGIRWFRKRVTDQL